MKCILQKHVIHTRLWNLHTLCSLPMYALSVYIILLLKNDFLPLPPPPYSFRLKSNSFPTIIHISITLRFLIFFGHYFPSPPTKRTFPYVATQVNILKPVFHNLHTKHKNVTCTVNITMFSFAFPLHRIAIASTGYFPTIYFRPHFLDISLL